MKTRNPYKWGATQFLSNMKPGETVVDDGTYRRRGLQVIACRLRRESRYEMDFLFHKAKGVKYITRLK